MTDTPNWNPEYADVDEKRQASGYHVHRCPRCRFDWTCAAEHGPENVGDRLEAAAYEGDQHLCDDCAWDDEEAGDRMADMLRGDAPVP